MEQGITDMTNVQRMKDRKLKRKHRRKVVREAWRESERNKGRNFKGSVSPSLPYTEI